LKTYLAPWTPALTPVGSGSKPGSAPPADSPATSSPVALESVGPEPDGFVFDPTFESWKPISPTDSGDNNTVRFMLGNDVAVKAAQTGNISPWPDGARFAKIAWQQEHGPDGLVHPGNFVQVELMPGCSSLQRHRGLGLGSMAGSGPEDLWRGRRLRERRYKLPLADARQRLASRPCPSPRPKLKRDEVVNNRAAALPASLPYQPLGWSAITLYIDRNSKTTATLYLGLSQEDRPASEQLAAAPTSKAGEV